MEQNIIAGLDIGTTKIACIICELVDAGGAEDNRRRRQRF